MDFRRRFFKKIHILIKNFIYWFYIIYHYIYGHAWMFAHGIA